MVECSRQTPEQTKADFVRIRDSGIKSEIRAQNSAADELVVARKDATETQTERSPVGAETWRDMALAEAQAVQNGS